MKVTPTAAPGRAAHRAAASSATSAASSSRPSTRERYARGRASPAASCRTTTRARAQGMLRGLHYQRAAPAGQAGQVVAARCSTWRSTSARGSPTFGQWVGVHAVRREPPAALGAARLRPRLLRAQRDAPTSRTSAPTSTTADDERVRSGTIPPSASAGRSTEPALSAKDAAGLTLAESSAPRPCPASLMILVTCSGGQVGRELLRHRHGTRRAHCRPRAHRARFSDADAVHAALAAHRPTLVVNAAAFTTVDRAEADPGAALAANRDGRRAPRRRLRRAWTSPPSTSRPTTCSTARSASRTPRMMRRTRSTCTVRASSQARTRRPHAAAPERHLRTSWVFSAHGHNFVRTMLRLAQQSPALSVVADQRGCPTPAIDLAVAILDIARQLEWGRDDVWGTYHLTGRGETTWYASRKRSSSCSAASAWTRCPPCAP